MSIYYFGTCSPRTVNYPGSCPKKESTSSVAWISAVKKRRRGKFRWNSFLTRAYAFDWMYIDIGKMCNYHRTLLLMNCKTANCNYLLSRARGLKQVEKVSFRSSRMATIYMYTRSTWRISNDLPFFLPALSLYLSLYFFSADCTNLKVILQELK